jgi:riboflavin synthase
MTGWPQSAREANGPSGPFPASFGGFLADALGAVGGGGLACDLPGAREDRCYTGAMFTGLVQTTGRVREIVPTSQAKRLVISATLSESDRALGASVAVSGVCLTVTNASSKHFEAEAAFETLRLTSLGSLTVGNTVNLEPALRLGDALGGHLVSGHVDGLGKLLSIEPRGDARECWFSAPAQLSRYVAEKGSICIDGVSLTVNVVEGNRFSVGLISHTLAATTLGERKPGDEVNLEVDLLARYVARLLETNDGGGEEDGGGARVTLESLRRNGFPNTGQTQGKP